MKRLKNLRNVAFAILVGASAWSCVDNDDFELPVIEKPVPVEIEAATAEPSVYEVGKYVKIHGNIVVDGKWSYFELKDGTRIQIYGASKEVSESLSDEQKKKLATPGQEATVTGTFKDYKLKNGEVVKEIVYNKAGDIVFGDSVVTPEVVKLEAADATVKDYEDNIGKEVQLHGKIVVKDNRAHFNFADGTLIQVYVKDFKEMSQEDKDKLNTAGQEVTIIGAFGEFKGTKQIQTTSKGLTFGETPDNGGATKVVKLEATNATIKDYEDNKGQEVQLHGKLVVENDRAHFKFADGTLIQVYVKGFKEMSQEDKDKLNTEGQEATIVGTFNEFKGTKQIQTTPQGITFGKASEGGGTPPAEGATGGIFKFDNVEVGGGYNKKNSIKQADGAVVLDYQANDDVPDTYKIDGKGLMVRNKEDGYVKLTFKNGVKNLSFDYRRAYTGNGDNRIIEVYKGTQLIETIDFTNPYKDVLHKMLKINETGEVTITLKVSTEGPVVFDNFAWGDQATAGEGNGETTPPANAGGEFDFKDLDGNKGEGITNGSATLSYNATKTGKNVPGAYQINDGGIMIKNDAGQFITITFKKGIKALSFNYKKAYTSKGNERKIVIYEGDESSEKVLGEKEFSGNGEDKYEIKLNKTGETTITIKSELDPITINNISWTE